MAGGIVKSWSNKQGSIALSSGEAEFYAAGKAAVEAIGGRSLLADLGWDVDLEVRLDASAAQAIASRQGLGKVRHVEVRYLWLQEIVRSGLVKLVKIKGSVNPADALTKAMAADETFRLLRGVGVWLLLPGAVSVGAGGVCEMGGCRHFRTHVQGSRKPTSTS